MSCDLFQPPMVAGNVSWLPVHFYEHTHQLTSFEESIVSYQLQAVTEHVQYRLLDVKINDNSVYKKFSIQNPHQV